MVLAQNSRSWLTVTTLLALVLGCSADRDIGNSDNPLTLDPTMFGWPGNGATSINVHENHTNAKNSNRWIMIHVKCPRINVDESIYYFLGDPHNWEARLEDRVAASALKGYKTGAKRAYYQRVATVIMNEVMVPAAGASVVWPQALKTTPMTAFATTLESLGAPLSQDPRMQLSYCGPFTPREASGVANSGPYWGHQHPRPNNGIQGHAPPALPTLAPQGPQQTYLDCYQVAQVIKDDQFAIRHFFGNSVQHRSFLGCIDFLTREVGRENPAAGFLGTNRSLSEETAVGSGLLTAHAEQRIIKIWKVYGYIREMMGLVKDSGILGHMQQILGCNVPGCNECYQCITAAARLQQLQHEVELLYKRFLTDLVKLRSHPETTFKYGGLTTSTNGPDMAAIWGQLNMGAGSSVQTDACALALQVAARAATAARQAMVQA